MKIAILLALAVSTIGACALPAAAQDRVVVRGNGWAPQIVVRQGHRGYWDERHHWRRATFVTHSGHHGFYDHHHAWHDWNR